MMGRILDSSLSVSESSSLPCSRLNLSTPIIHGFPTTMSNPPGMRSFVTMNTPGSLGPLPITMGTAGQNSMRREASAACLRARVDRSLKRS
ncbi:hypothetical protein DL93DRAFT_764512 [Clavulina sp. PMI_390]|nr:hypothetical protein DL93DRAFT_764512 [Clavulina sp. PMI_390]